MTFYRRQRQTGRSRFRISVIDNRTGKIVGEAVEVGGETAFTRLTILPFRFEWSDLEHSVERREKIAAPQE